MVRMADLYECFKFLALNVKDEIVVSGIGFFEWLALTPERDANLPIGQMGTTVPLAMGIACSLPHRKVLCLTTDGDLLMDLSVLPPLGKERPNNMIIVVNDNEVYQQTHAGRKGYWPTFTASGTDLRSVAEACGIKNAVTVTSVEAFATEFRKAVIMNELNFIVLKTQPVLLRAFRPDIDHVEYKYRFVRYIEKTEKVSIMAKEKQDRALLQSPSRKSVRPRGTLGVR